jgi:NACalpha-BTF3-like transcription factor
MEPIITEDQIKLVMRQTMYDEVKANEKLVYFKGDVIKVLRDYMLIPEPVEPVVPVVPV